jgi:nucleotide-binding universal stress UspA family protein
VRKWLSDNYRHWDVQTIKGPAEKELLNFLLRKRTLVVMGAYGRGIISRFFHQSMAEQLVDLSLFPVFITHY